MTEKAMRNLKILSAVIGIVQIILGLGFLFAPTLMLNSMGIDTPAADINYVLAMLAARFLVYGAGMFAIMRDPLKYRFWIDGMIAIQIIDLGAGIFYTVSGVIAIGASGLAMFNAGMFILLLMLWRPHRQTAVSADA